jgi:hypothetical protein
LNELGTGIEEKTKGIDTKINQHVNSINSILNTSSALEAASNKILQSQ